MTDGKTQKPKSDLATRTGAAIVMIAVAVAAIYFGGWAFRILVGAAAGVMLFEYCDMHKISRTWPTTGLALLAINLWLLPELLFGSPRLDAAAAEAVCYGFGAIVVAALGIGLASRSARLGTGYLYVAIPSLALLVLHGFSREAVVWAMIVTWSTDIFAYFAGRAIGGPKLAPQISPNKTWAGLIGGMAGAAVLGAVTAVAFNLPTAFLFAGAPMGLLAQMGDLYESGLKRKAGVKDSGKILPGHGGVLDRVDGLLPVVVATLALVAANAWA